MSYVEGDVAHDGVDSGRPPVKVGGVASSATPTAVSAGDAVRAWFGLNGQLAVALGIRGTGVDGVANNYTDPIDVSAQQAPQRVQGLVFNGTTWDRMRSGSAASLAAKSSLGAQLVTEPGHWSVVHLPAANTQATISKAAGGAGVQHIATALTATIAAGSGAPTLAATPVNVVVRDGAAGAGTIIWQSYLYLPAVAGECQSISLSGLKLVGSPNTAMTIEFSAAGGVNTFESVSLAGYSSS